MLVFMTGMTRLNELRFHFWHFYVSKPNLRIEAGKDRKYS